VKTQNKPDESYVCHDSRDSFRKRCFFIFWKGEIASLSKERDLFWKRVASDPCGLHCISHGISFSFWKRCYFKFCIFRMWRCRISPMSHMCVTTRRTRLERGAFSYSVYSVYESAEYARRIVWHTWTDLSNRVTHMNWSLESCDTHQLISRIVWHLWISVWIERHVWINLSNCVTHMNWSLGSWDTYELVSELSDTYELISWIVWHIWTNLWSMRHIWTNLWPMRHI